MTLLPVPADGQTDAVPFHVRCQVASKEPPVRHYAKVGYYF